MITEEFQKIIRKVNVKQRAIKINQKEKPKLRHFQWL